MSGQEEFSDVKVGPVDRRSGYDYKTGIFHSLIQLTESFNIPTRHDLGTAEFVLSQFPSPGYAESKVALIDSVTGNRVTYSQLMHSVRSLSIGLYHALGIRKGDVVFVLSPNCLIYPTICLAVLSLGAVLTTANPLNTESEIAKQVSDSEAKLGIASPDELSKLISSGLPTLVTTKSASLSVEDLIECCDSTDLELPLCELTQSDSAAVLYSSGTTGVSKGVVLTHGNFISVITLLKWSVYASSSENDIFLCLIPMFHIYGLAFFALGLFCSHITTVIMQKFDLVAMIDAVKTYRVGNIAAVPPVILGLVKNPHATASSLSSLRRMGTGAAPMSKEVADGFRRQFPWIELRQGYGLTESTGAASFMVADEDAKARQGSSGRLVPTFSAKVVDMETGNVLAPYGKGELWLRGPAIMKGYLNNEAASHATVDSDGWLKTGDLCYFDEDGFVYIVDRIKELIKHNGYQVAPAELESLLVSHPEILDAAVIPFKDEESGEIPMAYVVRTGDSKITEDQIIQFVATQVAPYKKIRRVSFTTAIPRSTAGKILRKELVAHSQQLMSSKL
ncbi:probable CoA ligase CCL5 [Impatiens glandulifera]|uniref:probable CoA ligase CCL5 n=1 Tax=Impatiens glandulifera TaxID=253017 RepID=UPI001FB05025|nr:probable CoA ligase CCL5 [Impatiens glandulifera]